MNLFVRSLTVKAVKIQDIELNRKIRKSTTGLYAFERNFAWVFFELN